MGPENRRYQLDRAVYALQRRRRLRDVDRLYQEIVGGWDQEAFRERFRKYWDPFPTIAPAKFLDLNTWLREAIFRSLWCGMDRPPAGRKVLDLGVGTGYFLVACRHLGHEALGLDLGDTPLYDECIDFFGLPRALHRIEPFQPLPDACRSFDVITAFMTCFNVRPDGSPWGAEEWDFLLRDLRSRLSDQGRLIVRFNLNPQTREFYPESVRQTMLRQPQFRTKLFFDYAFFEAR